MQVSQVTQDDGIAMAQILRALQAARFDNLTTKDMDSLSKARAWLGVIAADMGKQLQFPTGSVGDISYVTNPANSSNSDAGSPGSFRISNMGPIGSGPNKRKRKK